jgi:two-component system, LytTR family, response regulator
MKIRCIIVDDEPLARNLLSDYVQKVPYLELIDACSSPMVAMEVMHEKEVDLMFLDVQMPEITGLGLLKVLKQKPQVILTTAYSEYALQGYEHDVLDYLLKPISFERFLKAVDKAAQRLQDSRTSPAPNESTEALRTYIFVKDGNKLIKVRLADILYLEAMKDYVAIHTPDQKILTYQRMKTLEAQLPAGRFIRIHHSYIVALEAIEMVHKNEVQIGKTFLPVSESYRKTFRDFIERNHLT